MNKLATIFLCFATICAAIFVFLAIAQINKEEKKIFKEPGEATTVAEEEIPTLKRTKEHVEVDIDPATYVWRDIQKIEYFDGKNTTHYTPMYSTFEGEVKDISISLEKEGSNEEYIKISETRWEEKLNEFIKFVMECKEIAENYEMEDGKGIIGYIDEEEPEEEYDGHLWKEGENIKYFEGKNIYQFVLKGKTTVYFEKIDEKGSAFWSYPLSYEFKTHVEDFAALNRVLDSKINGGFDD